jgi:tRNA (guanine37-N1)-methyltransferase
LVMGMGEAPCISVPKVLGEEAIRLAIGLELIDRGLRVKKRSGRVFIPLIRELSKGEVKILEEKIEGLEASTLEFKEVKKRPRSLLEALKGKLPPHLLAHLPQSMDVVGRVAIIEVPLDLVDYEDLLGVAVMEVHKQVETVLAKLGAVGGELRLRNYKVIAGVGNTETFHREHGCIYHLDPTEVYFSPRLSREHWRIARQVEEGETVIDMFAGVGPFSIQIGKKHREVKVYAIDINPDAYNYLRENVEKNKVQDRVFPLLGDAEAIIKGNYLGVADRVIMNLPERAIEFVGIACEALKSAGGVLHYYGFEAEPDALGRAREKLSKAVSNAGRVIEEFTGLRKVRAVAPHEWQVALDAVIR